MSRLKISKISDELLAKKLEMYFVRCKIAAGEIALSGQLPAMQKAIASMSGSDELRSSGKMIEKSLKKLNPVVSSGKLKKNNSTSKSAQVKQKSDAKSKK